ncbi:copper homeostasis protein CutC [Streptococcus massiliensis]|uniref:PF03932 family protein CutC n=1 Tax=Streptococcus massiliensis TaxID=313439 RepID=A0A380KXK9_9STRE|nr:copper homeostasis protein CutC [Streptococcus massiliensis]SUN75676.1 copper homeostasis protein [Streptococcus massiliensis]
MIYEFCAENLTDLQKAFEAGARRVELCDNLAVGGTTPSYGIIKEACIWARKNDVDIQTMIRPRGGDFVYNPIEVESMIADIAIAIDRGSNGVVLGCLTDEGWLDEAALAYLSDQVDHFRSLGDECELVFHMAFDCIPRERQFEAIDWLAENGFSRILTRAGKNGDSLEERLAWYKELIKHAAGRLTILPGGGINLDNRQRFIDELGVNELHGSKVVFS